MYLLLLSLSIKVLTVEFEFSLSLSLSLSQTFKCVSLCHSSEQSNRPPTSLFLLNSHKKSLKALDVCWRRNCKQFCQQQKMVCVRSLRVRRSHRLQSPPRKGASPTLRWIAGHPQSQACSLTRRLQFHPDKREFCEQPTRECQNPVCTHNWSLKVSSVVQINRAKSVNSAGDEKGVGVF